MGFDILIDQNLKPWLIEINGPPQLTIDTKVDVMVKYKMVKDMVRVLFELNKRKVADFCRLRELANNSIDGFGNSLLNSREKIDGDSLERTFPKSLRKGNFKLIFPYDTLTANIASKINKITSLIN